MIGGLEVKYATLLVVVITLSGQCAAASPSDQGALPEGSRLLSDHSGRSVGCLPPPGEPASEAFDKKCKQHLQAAKKLRRAPQKPASISSATVP